MLESYFSLLIETINMIIGARTHLQNKNGCKKLFLLYQSLDRILKSSLDVRRELAGSLTEDRHREQIYLSLKKLSECTHDFTKKLHELRYDIEIFDFSLARDLAILLGFKYFLLHYVCSHSKLVKPSDKQKILLRINIDAEKIRSNRHYPLPWG